LKDETPEKTNWVASAMHLSKKGEKRSDLQSQNGVGTKISLEEMEHHLCEIEMEILAMEKLFKNDEMMWWNKFFEEQREFNNSLLIEDRTLSMTFKWPKGQSEHEFVAPTPMVLLDEAEIDDRVYGPTRDIYVGPYRNQKKIELEKENMSGDFSDLEINTYISVAGEEETLTNNFWVAKVEKIVRLDSENIPQVISVLWYAAKDSSDPWKSQYLPEILKFEKKRSGKGKKSLNPTLHRQDLDLTTTTVFAYNFFLTKGSKLYSNTVKRIQLRLSEYLVEKGNTNSLDVHDSLSKRNDDSFDSGNSADDSESI
jgi:hypothetical protein